MMKLELLNNIGTRDQFALGLDGTLQTGATIEVSDEVGEKLVRRGLGKVVEIKGVPEKPAIAKAKKSEE